MKTIKFFLVSLFMILGLAAQAQQVVITKTDGTTETFQASEVDSVVYATKMYYYYAGGGKIGEGEVITGIDEDDLPTGVTTSKLGTQVASSPWNTGTTVTKSSTDKVVVVFPASESTTWIGKYKFYSDSGYTKGITFNYTKLSIDGTQYWVGYATNWATTIYIKVVN